MRICGPFAPSLAKAAITSSAKFRARTGCRFVQSSPRLLQTIGGGSGNKPEGSAVAFIKGPNQLRLHRRTAKMRFDRLGEVEAFATQTPDSEMKRLPRHRTNEFIRLLVYALLILVFGRKRDLSLYLLTFSRATQRIVDNHLRSVETFICYNDQPFDVSAIIYALNRRRDCKTIVLQHGIIVSPSFYFPTIAREFWAWGEESKQSYSTRCSAGSLVVTGRYSNDTEQKAMVYRSPISESRVVVLVAFSFDHEEIQGGLRYLSNLVEQIDKRQIDRPVFQFKFHPATKQRSAFAASLLARSTWLTTVEGDMEDLAQAADALITFNSTSAVEFLLRGKPVVFIDPSSGGAFPSASYGLNSDEFIRAIASNDVDLSRKNVARLEFLKATINV